MQRLLSSKRIVFKSVKNNFTFLLKFLNLFVNYHAELHDFTLIKKNVECIMRIKAE